MPTFKESAMFFLFLFPISLPGWLGSGQVWKISYIFIFLTAYLMYYTNILSSFSMVLLQKRDVYNSQKMSIHFVDLLANAFLLLFKAFLTLLVMIVGRQMNKKMYQHVRKFLQKIHAGLPCLERICGVRWNLKNKIRLS